MFFGYHGTFIESGNVYIETKRNVDPYIAFDASVRGRMAGKSGLVNRRPWTKFLTNRKGPSYVFSKILAKTRGTKAFFETASRPRLN